ncbi:MAG: type I-MYXAN CRISPR-associated Cas8a1/Cmx1 [Polyangiales bacterium]
MGELTVDLHAPGMTPLHRAGAAGLYMTVRALQRRKVAVPGLAAWESTPHKVTLRWEGAAADFFEGLVRAAYGIDDDGLVEFAAIDRSRASFEALWIAHEGMFGTFCQFGPNNALGERRTKVVTVDGQHPQHFEYKPVLAGQAKSYPHRDKGGALIGSAIDAGRDVGLVGWLFPGAVVRHVAFGEATAMDESPARALALVFAPVGCFFYKLQSRSLPRKARAAIVVPEFDDLEAYAMARDGQATKVRTGEVVVTGAGHAALELLASLASRNLLREHRLPRLTVTMLGIVTWNEKQKSRTGRIEVELKSDRALRDYQRLRAVLGEQKVVQRKDGGTFLSLSPSLELFTENIVAARPFFAGFAGLMANNDVRAALAADRKGLNMAVSRGTGLLDDEAQQAFVEACHEALRRSYRIAGERASGEQVDVNARLAKEYDRWRYAFAKAKNADAFREAITDFWSRGGANGPLQGQWRAMLPLLSGPGWRLARDLALLALASYARADQPAASDAHVQDEKENQE